MTQRKNMWHNRCTCNALKHKTLKTQLYFYVLTWFRQKNTHICVFCPQCVKCKSFPYLYPFIMKLSLSHYLTFEELTLNKYFKYTVYRYHHSYSTTYPSPEMKLRVLGNDLSLNVYMTRLLQPYSSIFFKNLS